MSLIQYLKIVISLFETIDRLESQTDSLRERDSITRKLNQRFIY